MFSGSLPRQLDAGLYAELVRETSALGVKCVLDSEGESMRLGTRAGPALVCPNELESEELVGHEFPEPDDRLRALAEMVELGADEAIMTLESGCVALVGDEDDRRLYRVKSEPVETVSAVGSGDALLAGFVAARREGRSPEECLRNAVACGAESTRHFGAGVLDPREVERLAGDVEIELVDQPALQPLS